MFHPDDLILKQKKVAVCRTLQDKLLIKYKVKLCYYKCLQKWSPFGED